MKHRQKTMKKSEKSTCELWEAVEQPNIWVTGIPQKGKRERTTTTKIQKQKTTLRNNDQKFQNLMKTTNSQIKEMEQI